MGFGNLVGRATGRTVRATQPMNRPQQRVAPREHVPTAAPSPAPVEVANRVIARTTPNLDPYHVSKLVAQSDRSPEVARSGGNPDGYLHLSSLIDACNREHCISRQHGEPMSSAPSGPMRVVWRLGRAAEKHVRDGVIKARDFNGIYGRWTCQCNSDSYTGTFQPGRVCSVCKRQVSLYREPVLRNDLYRVVGSPDLTLIELGYHLVIEIKSMNKEQYDALDGPLYDHVMQACGYWWMYEQLGFRMMPEVRILYVRKDFKFSNANPGTIDSIYREFRVRPADYEYQIERLMVTALDMHAHNEQGTLPDRICDTRNHSRAKGCPRRTLCFNLD